MKTPLTYKVTGSRHGFPLDMLRYDCCWPTGQSDVDLLHILTGPREDRRDLPKIVTVSLSSHRDPTVERWESFNWRIVT